MGAPVASSHRLAVGVEDVRGEVEEEVDLLPLGAGARDADVLGAVGAVVDLRPRVGRVVVGELGGRRVVLQRVGRVDAPGGQDLRLRDVAVVERQRLRPGDGVVARLAVDPVVAETAVDDVGVVGVLGRGRVGVVREQTGLVEQLPGREGEGLGVRPGDRLHDIGRIGRIEVPQRLGEPVTARVVEPVVAEDRVVAGAAVDAVVAGAADDRVVLAATEQDVVSGFTEDEVVAGLAVDEVRGPDVVRSRGARGVVEQRPRARDDPLERGVVVVVEGEERQRHLGIAVGVGGGAPAGADEPVEVAVVAEDRVGVVGVALGRQVAHVVDADPRSGSTVDGVRPVGAQRGRDQPEHRAAAADEVVLAEVAPDDVVAPVALDVVVAVGAGPRPVLDRAPRVGDGVAGLDVEGDLATVVDDRAVALDPVVALLAEQDVVTGAARDVRVGRRAGGRCVAHVIQRDVADRGSARILLEAIGRAGTGGVRGGGAQVEPLAGQGRPVVVGSVDVRRAGGGVEDARTGEYAEARAEDGAGAQDRRVVAGDDVVTRASVEEVAVGAGAGADAGAVRAVGAAGGVEHVAVGHVAAAVVDTRVPAAGPSGAADGAGHGQAGVAADDVVVAGAAADPVGSPAADEDVVARIPGDEVVAVVGRRHGVERTPGEGVVVERHVERQLRRVDPASGRAGVGGDLDAVDRAEVAEGEVVAGVAPDGVATTAAEEEVVAEIALDGVADAVLRLHGLQVHEFERRLDPLQAYRVDLDECLGRLVEQPLPHVLDVLDDLALVAEDDVGVVGVSGRGARRRAEALTDEHVVSGEQGVRVRAARSGSRLRR